MWSNYTKTFVFRDCFDEINVEDNVKAINKLLSVKQHKGGVGAFICTDLIGTDIATSIEAYRHDDTGEWNLNFYDADYDLPPIATLTIDKFREIQLRFEIEENLDNGNLIIHYCTIKGFKEYQM